MSQVRYQLPERPKGNQPTSRFNYRVHIDRSPSASRNEEMSPFGREQSVFTFDHSTGKSKSKQLPLFEPFEDTNTQTIAKNLIEQNMLLKEDLKKHQKIIKELEGELVYYRNQMQEFGRANSRQFLLEDMKEQIRTILSKNKMVEQELSSLRQILPMITLNLEQTRDTLPQYSDKMTRCRQSSLDFKRTTKPGSDQQKNNLDLGKSDELVSSIKNMHLKIMGFRVQSLKELWRWLKNIGYTYSTFKKWQCKVQSSTQYWQSSPEKMKVLLEQLIAQC